MRGWTIERKFGGGAVRKVTWMSYSMAIGERVLSMAIVLWNISRGYGTVGVHVME